jgi:hypothetical protein
MSEPTTERATPDPFEAARRRQIVEAAGIDPSRLSEQAQGTTVDHQYRTANRRQAAARDAYRASVANGTPLTGAELGRQFNRTDRWGRYQIGQVRADDNGASGRTAIPPTFTRDMAATALDPASAIRDLAASSHTGSHPSPPSTEPLSADVGSPKDVGTHRSWLNTLITLVVALVAAAASYGHMLEVASLAGEPLWLARAFPITVDGLVLAAIRRGDEGRRWLALGAAVSIAANVLAQFPDQAAAAGPIVSAWPPLALYGTHHLVQSSHRSPHRQI